MLRVGRSFARLPAKEALQFQAKRGLQGLTVGVPKESLEGECRVSLTPTNVVKLNKAGASVVIEKNAGLGSGFTDAQYENAGAKIVGSEEAWKAEVVTKVRPPTIEEAVKIENRSIMSIIQPRVNTDLMEQLIKQNANVFSMDSLLRTLSRGQAYDVLSSQANIAGYRAVIEASHNLQRPFAGQMTAAGKVAPAKVLVVGAGVAGLAALQLAKKKGAITYGFDVRAAAAEQVESCGAKFLKVEVDEDGSGAGGYAKEMSEEWFKAADAMLLKECANMDVIITTALIPGRKAPVLIKKNMVEAMPYGGVTVDLAAPAGGNVETTVPNQVVTVGKNEVKCVGYTNMESRMGQTASSLFGGNVTNFLMSMEDKETKKWKIDLEDPAVRSILVAIDGKALDPYVPPPPPPPKEPTEAEKAAAAAALLPRDFEGEYKKSALFATAGTASALGLASMVPNAPMMSTFALSCWVGNSCVQGVTHALHSPLMAMTNAISGMTIVGGMLQLGGGMLPGTLPQVLAAGAVGLSAVNLVGGTIVTKKMLDMFKRPDDPPEYNHYYLAPAGAAIVGSSALYATGLAPAALTPSLALASALGCVGGISCLSSQTTARLGISVGMGGIATGIVATLASMNPALAATYGQFAVLTAGGGGLGYAIAQKIGPTELPQAVAAFHSLVGLAAAATAVGDFMVHDPAHAVTAFHNLSLYLGAWMGSITATGSVIAYGKLAGSLDSAALQLPGRDQINMGLGAASVIGLGTFMVTGDPTIGALALTTGVLSSGALGLHMTASIGGADMPVVITLLNSYSGWALCAEGFILDQPLLTVVGALIGSSGAFLTRVMCEAMNRSLPNVILGGFGTVQTKKEGPGEILVHTEIDAAGTAEALKAAEKVLIVPGYGMAVAQAASVVADITMGLRKDGKDVKFAVHPVAGRMPGQLNVLLAEAGIPYDMVFEMEEINPEMAEFDVTMIIGANDTVNSGAEDDPDSAIAGMPVIQVWNSKHTVFMKRSMAVGYAGVDNPVFFKSNNDMLLGDAKATCEKIRDELNK
jgi:NAD(P) transhydrogenase